MEYLQVNVSYGVNAKNIVSKKSDVNAFLNNFVPFGIIQIPYSSYNFNNFILYF